MPAIAVTADAVKCVKRAVRQFYGSDAVLSSHLSEALARALGYRTHAGLVAALRVADPDPEIRLLDDEAFLDRLVELGYPDDQEYRNLGVFDDLIYEADGAMIETRSRDHRDYQYRSPRQRAWRNIMVATVNEGIRRKLFSLRPGDNRWPGYDQENDRYRPSHALFDFVLDGNIPIRGYVSDADFDELSVHAAAFPKGDWVRANNAGFTAGEAFAAGWLERRAGAWLQYGPEQLRCRRALLARLSELDVRPLGYGDSGRLMM